VVRLGTKLALALIRLLAAVTGLDELVEAVALPLAFIEYYAEEKKRESGRGEGA